jgi:large subunit ribosomal protein L2
MATWIKHYKPTSPGIRHKVSLEGMESGSQLVPKSLTRGARRTGGRNNTGRITCFHRGGGLKRRHREVTSLRPWESGVVRGIQRDPSRQAWIALVERTSSLTYKYVLAGEGMQVGNVVQCRVTAIGSDQQDPVRDAMSQVVSHPLTHAKRGLRDPVHKPTEVTLNHRYRLGHMPIGTQVYDLMTTPYSQEAQGKRVKTPGTHAVVLRHKHSDETTYMGAKTRVEMPSGEHRWRPSTAMGTVGSVAGKDHVLEKTGKAGLNRRRGIRPTVRGCAMNPVDHPHGGRTKGGRHDVTPWARIAKGQPTRAARKPMGLIVKTARVARQRAKGMRV